MIYLINGDDEFSKNEYLEKIKKRFLPLKKGVNYIFIDKDNISTLGEELTTYSFFSEPKLIVVKVPKTKNSKTEEETKNEDADIEQQSQSKASNWLTDDLIEKIHNKIETITLVFVEEGTLKSKISKLVIECGGKVESFVKKDTDKTLSRWIIEFANQNKHHISVQDANYLSDICGKNKQSIYNELIKLFSYVEVPNITKDDIDLMCMRTPEVVVFELTDSMGKRNVKKALQVLDELLASKEAIQKIFIIIANHYMKLIVTKELMERSQDVAKYLEIKEYPASKYKEQASKFTKSELITIYKKLAKLDIDSKLSKIDLKLGLQKIIME